MNFISKLADNRLEKSFANKLRKKRFLFFESLLNKLPKPVKVIDIGGTEDYWEKMGVLPSENIHITILNTKIIPVKYPNVQSIAGDARNMKQFNDNSFDIAFSNSVIEHVGNFCDQQAMAKEMIRIAPRLYLQTPNKYFPIEPHFLFPFFQFLPIRMRVWLLMHFKLGWYPRHKEKHKAEEVAKSIRLLSLKELKKLFPKANIKKERILGFPKSFVVTKGWD